MFIFKSIDESDVSTTETVVHKQQSLHSGSNGITSAQYRSGSKTLVLMLRMILLVVIGTHYMFFFIKVDLV